MWFLWLHYLLTKTLKLPTRKLPDIYWSLSCLSILSQGVCGTWHPENGILLVSLGGRRIICCVHGSVASHGCSDVLGCKKF